MSYGESVGFSGSQNSGSRPRDHRSQFPCRSLGSHIRNGAQHTCGLPQLSLHGFGLPRTTSEVFARPTGIVLRPFMVTSPRSYPPPAMAKGRMCAMGHWMLRFTADLIRPAGVTPVTAGGAILHRPLRCIRSVTLSFTIGYTRQSQKGPI